MKKRCENLQNKSPGWLQLQFRSHIRKLQVQEFNIYRNNYYK